MPADTLLDLKDEVDLEARFGRRALGLEGGGFSDQRLAPNVTWDAAGEGAGPA